MCEVLYHAPSPKFGGVRLRRAAGTLQGHLWLDFLSQRPFFGGGREGGGSLYLAASHSLPCINVAFHPGPETIPQVHILSWAKARLRNGLIKCWARDGGEVWGAGVGGRRGCCQVKWPLSGRFRM